MVPQMGLRVRDSACCTGARREFMRAHTDAVFLALAESLVEHSGVVSSINGTFWRNGRFVDESYARLRPAPNMPSLTRQA